MGTFSARAVTFTGSLTADAGIEEVFPLFSPQGERLWVPGWDPEILHPPGSEWREGQVFRTREETGEAVWVITRLDRARHAAEYHRVEPGRYVAHVSVRCSSPPDGGTQVRVAYSYVGLSDDGNAEIDAMTGQAYDAKMSRWSEWIAAHLASRR